MKFYDFEKTERNKQIKKKKQVFVLAKKMTNI